MLADNAIIEEMEEVLFKVMKTGKAPGKDILTVELYRALWKNINGALFNSITNAIETGEMAPAKRQSQEYFPH